MRRLGPFGSLIVLLCLAACLAPGGYLLATKDGRDWNAIKQEIRDKYPEVAQLTIDAFAKRLEEPGAKPLVFDVRAEGEFGETESLILAFDPPGTSTNDVGHGDILMMDSAGPLVWEPIYRWVIAP